jgi:hypothetical protein
MLRSLAWLPYNLELQNDLIETFSPDLHLTFRIKKNPFIIILRKIRSRKAIWLDRKIELSAKNAEV